VLSLITLGVAIYEHEQIHQAIMNEYGCKNIKITYGIFNGETQCMDNGYIENTDEIKLHTTNEMIGYNMNVVILILTVIGFFTIMMRKDEI